MKGEGGITFAQAASSAKYDGMPASAIASGCVGFHSHAYGDSERESAHRHHPYIAGRADLETAAGWPRD